MVAAELAGRKLDALLVSSAANIRYLTGFTGSSGALLILPDDAVLFTDPRYAIQSGREVSCKIKVSKGPLLPGVAIFSILVMLGDDLGTTFILLVIFLALLWVIGTPVRLFIGMLGLMGFALLVLTIVASYRLARIMGFLHPHSTTLTNGWQTLQGTYAVGSGGWFGVGLGAGKLKWGWVPNATIVFIFAIIGEELGLIGTLCVTFLYGGLAYAGLRIARRVFW